MKPKLTEVLERSKALGFFGPSEIETQVEHALLYSPPLVNCTGRVLDLGAGGGLPSLPLLCELENLNITMLDAHERRTSFLSWAITELELSNRASVVRSRAEVFGQSEENREAFEVVIARGFGPPAMTLECASPLLVVGGRFIVSEPPTSREWPADALQELKLTYEPADGLAIFTKTESCDAKYPRKAKDMKRAPLF